MTTFRALPLLAAFALCAAASAQVIPPAGKAPFRMLQMGQNSNVKEQKLIVIRNQADLDRYWSTQLNQQRGTAPSNVDWIRYKVVAVHLGQRPTGGYRFFVNGIDESRGVGTAILRATEITPTPGTFVTQAVTSPWTLVMVDNKFNDLRLSVMRREGTGVMLPGAPGGGRPGPTPCQCDCPYCCGH